MITVFPLGKKYLNQQFYFISHKIIKYSWILEFKVSMQQYLGVLCDASKYK